MKRELNLEQLRFHVMEAQSELTDLLLAIEHTLGKPVAKGGKWNLPGKPLAEWMLHGSLYHAYHHLNFAWNTRFKTAEQAESQFDRNEKFPRREFERYWPKSALKNHRTPKKRPQQKFPPCKSYCMPASSPMP